MIIQCESCSKKFVVRDVDIPKEGRVVQCGNCSVTWHQMPILTPKKAFKKTKNTQEGFLENCTEYFKSKNINFFEAKKFSSRGSFMLPIGKMNLPIYRISILPQLSRTWSIFLSRVIHNGRLPRPVAGSNHNLRILQ